MIGAQSFKRHRTTEASSASQTKHGKAVATSQELTDDLVATHRSKRQKRSAALLEPKKPTKQRLPNELLCMIIQRAHADSQSVLLLPKSMNRPTSDEIRNFDPRFFTFKEETEPYNDELEFYDDFEAASFDASTDGSFVPKFSTPHLNLLLVSRLFRDEGYKAFYSNNSFSLIDYNHGLALQQAIGDNANLIRHITVEQRWQPKLYFLEAVAPSSERRLSISHHENYDCDVYPTPPTSPV